MLASFCSPLSPLPTRSPVSHRSRWVPTCVRASPLKLGNSIELWPPVIQAPVSDVTHYPFRAMCYAYGAPVCIASAIDARTILDPNLPDPYFHESETVRSIRLRGSDPAEVRDAAAVLISKHQVRHIDVDFSGYSEKLIRAGRGVALTDNPQVVQRITAGAVAAAASHDVAVTACIRLGLYWNQLNYPETARAVRFGGAQAITLQTRTASDVNEVNGNARRAWAHASALSKGMDIPVLVEGDIYTAADALKIMKACPVAGVVLAGESWGRPWLHEDLLRGFNDGWAAEATIPSIQYVCNAVLRHLKSEIAYDKKKGLRNMRKWYMRYFNGYNGLPHQFVVRLCKAKSVKGVEAVLAEADPEKVDYKFMKGFGKYMELGYMEHRLPKLPKDAPVKKRGSGSQRGPVTLKGNIEKILREKAKKERDEEEKRERRRKAREKSLKRRFPTVQLPDL